MRAPLPRNRPNLLQHLNGISQHIHVLEPHDTISEPLKILRATIVVPELLFFLMLAAVQFNDQEMAEAHEVRIIRAQGNLSPKLETIQSSIAQAGP